jgi:hypothetical protein
LHSFSGTLQDVIGYTRHPQACSAPSSRIASQTRLCPLGVGLYQVYTGYQPRFVLHTETLYLYCGQAGDDSMCDGAGNCGGGAGGQAGREAGFYLWVPMVGVRS